MNKNEGEKVILSEASGPAHFPDSFLSHFHTHIFCHRGTLDFVFNDKPYTCKSGDFVFWFAESKVTELKFSAKFKASALFVEKKFLDENIPDRNWSIDALLYSMENPVLHLNDKSDKPRVLMNFRVLHDKFSDTGHRFYDEVLKLQMQVFLLEMWHTFANEYEHRKRTLQSGTLYERFMQLAREHCMKEREVQYYANELNITAKYLNYVCKRNTDITASEWIQRYARERIILLLQNKDLNISEIADEMNFSSRSFFTRYVKKLLGLAPRDFRNRLE